LNKNHQETQNQNQNESNNKDKERSKFVRTLYVIAGTICLVLGIIGIILPVLPTTPFLLLSAACYARGSERFYNWLLNNRILGPYIRNYREGKGMPIKTKIFTITTLWITILISIFFFAHKILWLTILLIVIASAVSTHIILIRPKNRSNK
jgi:uncharacterized membrane protein YbaN (DUF454 family)